MNNKQLYKISKFAYKEAFLESQLEMAGSNTAQILEKMEKNSNYMRNQDIVMKVVVALYLAAMVILPVQVYSLLNDAVESGIPSQWAIFAGGVSFSIFFAIQLIFLVTFGVFLSSGFFSGEEFKWLTTLPLSKQDLQKITFFTFFRTVDAQFFVLALGFPITTFFVTKNIFITVISLIISFLNIIFSFGLLAIIGEKLHRIMKNSDVNSKKASIIRVSVMVGYAVLTLGIALSFQMIIPKVGPFFKNYPSNLEQIQLINNILPIIPYPFSSGFLISNLYIYINNQNISTIQMLSPVLGVLVLIIVNLRFYRKVMQKMNNIIFPKIKKLEGIENQKITEIKDIELTILEPVDAFFKRDKKMASRDIQVIMMIVMPILLPLIGYFSMSFGGEDLGDELGTVVMVINLSYWMMSGVLIIYTLMNVERSGSTITQSLPINTRDQAKAKIRWLLIILPISSFIPLILSIGKESFLTNLVFALITMAIGPLTGILTLILRVRLFGKMRYKYVLGEINIAAKVWKWVLIIVIDTIFYVFIVTAFTVIMMTYDLAILSMVFIIGEAVILFILLYFFNRMFPRMNVPKI